MKKIYLLAVMTAVGTLSFAQSAQTAVRKATDFKKESAEQNVTEKAPGVTLWSDTFDDPTNWVIDGDGAQGSWVIGTTNDLQDSPQYFAAITSTTVNDGFAFFEGIGFLLDNNVLAQNAWIEMANSIDLSAHEYVNFSFEQAYRAFADITYVEVSLDGGTTWTTAGSTIVNPEVQGNTSTSADVTEKFFVDNSATVKFRFRWESANSGYAWQVDDVNISTLPDNDIKVTNHYFGSVGLPYYQIPEAQIAPIDMSVNVVNSGLNAQEGVDLSANETVVGSFSSTSGAVVIPFEGEDSLGLATSFTPPGIGNYSIDFEILNDSVDDTPANNQVETYAFEVTDFIYARDNGTADGSISGSYYQAEPTLEPGTLYDIFTNANLTGIDVTFGGSQPAGVEVFGRIYEATATSYDLVSETDFYTCTAADAGSEVTLLFPTPVALEAGKTYVASVGSFTAEMIVASAGQSETGTSIVYGDLGTAGEAWYVEPSTPMIRMNFNPTVSVENNEVSNLNVSQNFPNPFSNETTVEYTLENASEVSYTVVDLAGNTILDVNEGNVSAGKHAITIEGSSLANGVYYFNMTAGDAQTTHKMIVNK